MAHGLPAVSGPGPREEKVQEARFLFFSPYLDILLMLSLW